MGTLSAIALTTCMLLATWGGWRAGLRSLCASEHWRREVQRTSQGFKTQASWSPWSLPSRACGGSIQQWGFKGKLVGNQQGSIEILGVGLLMVLGCLLVLQAVVWQKRHDDVRRHLQQTLCLKAVIGETHQLIDRVGKLNAAIKAGEVTTWGLTLLGGIGLALKPNWEQVKKALQLAQELAWGSTQKELLQLRNGGCEIPFSVWPSPYKWRGLLQRTVDGRALSYPQGVWHWKTPLMTYFVNWKLPHSSARHAQWQVH